MIVALQPKYWFFFLYLFYLDENIAHSIAAKQRNGDLTFHVASYLASSARVTFLWGPPHHPALGFPFP